MLAEDNITRSRVDDRFRGRSESTKTTTRKSKAEKEKEERSDTPGPCPRCAEGEQNYVYISVHSMVSPKDKARKFCSFLFILSVLEGLALLYIPYSRGASHFDQF